MTTAVPPSDFVWHFHYSRCSIGEFNKTFELKEFVFTPDPISASACLTDLTQMWRNNGTIPPLKRAENCEKQSEIKRKDYSCVIFWKRTMILMNTATIIFCASSFPFSTFCVHEQEKRIPYCDISTFTSRAWQCSERKKAKKRKRKVPCHNKNQLNFLSPFLLGTSPSFVRRRLQTNKTFRWKSL